MLVVLSGDTYKDSLTAWSAGAGQRFRRRTGTVASVVSWSRLIADPSTVDESSVTTWNIAG